MYPVFPTLALVRSKTGISVRQASRILGVSHTYLSQLEDFMVVPPPDMRVRNGRLLIAEVKYFIQEAGVFPELEVERLSLEADHAFFSLRESLWYGLLMRPDGGGCGYLWTALLRCYFHEQRKRVVLFLPQARKEEPLLSDVIANFFERHYTAESFRRRRPRDWKPVPPFFSGRERYGLVFTTEFPDARQIFYAHPSAYYVTLFLFYVLLQEILVSASGFSCCWNNVACEIFAHYEAPYRNYRDYAAFSGYNSWRKTPPPLCKARFTLTPPAFYSVRHFGVEKSPPEYAPLPENTVIKICTSDLFWPSEFCWCLAPAL